jgi:hypothetical protein
MRGIIVVASSRKETTTVSRKASSHRVKAFCLGRYVILRRHERHVIHDYSMHCCKHMRHHLLWNLQRVVKRWDSLY